MLEYDKIDISEDIDTNKTSSSKECKICHYSLLTMNHIFAVDVMI